MKAHHGLAIATLVLALPAVAAAGPHPHDYPTSLTFLSPAQLARFDEPTFAVDAAYADRQERSTWDLGTDTNNETASLVTLRLVRKASPSLYWDATVLSDTENTATGNSAITGAGLDQGRLVATTAGADAAYKILDRLVVALGAALRRSTATPASGSASALNEALASQAVMLTGENGELGWAQTLLFYQGGYFRQTLVHGRWHVSPDFLLAADATVNPQPACCLGASDAEHIVYGVTPTWQSGPVTTEVRVTYAPAYLSGTDYDVARTGLAAQVYYDLGRWALAARVTYDFGHESSASVLIPSPLGPVTSADTLALDRGVALGVVYRL